MPYGDPNRAEGGDWLGLGDRKARNPAGAGRRDFRIAPNQIVGGVFITRDGNPELVDTSGREGLVHREPFDELKGFLYSCLFRLEAHYHKLYVKRKKRQSILTSPRETVREFGVELRTLRENIQSVKENLPKSAERKIELVQDQLGTASNKIARMERSIEELASQATIYRGLASLGIATATFSHETGLALDHFLSCLHAAMNLLKASSPDVKTALIELDKSIGAGKRISAWGRFALRRIRPDMRRKRVISVNKTLDALIAELREPFEASQIDLVVRLRDVEARVFPMDIESVALNFLTNAYQFVKIGKRQRRVRMTLAKARRDGSDGFEISVADSGPGVSRKMRDKIWKPLFSTKLDGKGHAYGTGLGLSIVNDVVNDLGGVREVDRDRELNGALFTIWLPLT